MKAILEFNLPDDQMEFNRASQSLDMACALFDILQLRKATERKCENMAYKTEDIFDGIQFMAEGINEILEEHNINIDKLIE
jgi:hypothetical protein